MFRRKERATSVSSARITDLDQPPEERWTTTLCRYIYNREKKHLCERSFKSWILIIGYSIMYLLFLCTYTMIFLYFSLLIIKKTTDFEISEKIHLLKYSDKGIGLSVTPTELNPEPLIWYVNEPDGYQKYVKSIENLLGRRRKRDANTTLGPCGTYPFGYGDAPCIILRINKQLNWSAKPLNANTSVPNIPSDVRKWMKLDKQKLWLFCSGLDSYDKEHVKSIKYYPYPPGFDPDLYPMNLKNDSPLVGVQIRDFSFGISLTIKCSLWYEGGVSTAEFLLYVTDK